MIRRIGVWAIAFFATVHFGSGQDEFSEIESKALKVHERIESIKNSLRGRGFEGADVTTLSEEEMWEACEWALSEYKNWPYRKRDHSALSDIASPDPFGFEEPSAESGAGGQKGEVPDVYDFSFLLSDLFSALFFEDSQAFAKRYPELLSRYSDACLDPYLQRSLLNPLLLIRLWEVAQVNVSEEWVSHWLDEGVKKNVPAILSNSEKLRDVWTVAQTVRAVLESSSVPGAEGKEIEAGQDPEFYRIQFAGLLDDDWSEWEKIRRYTWWHFCGTGSEEFQWQRLAYLAVAQAEQGDMLVSHALLMFVAGPFRSFLMMAEFRMLEEWSDLVWNAIEKSEGPWDEIVAGMVLYPAPYLGWHSVPTDWADEAAIRLICEGVELDPEGEEINGKVTLRYLLDLTDGRSPGLFGVEEKKWEVFPELRREVSDAVAILVRIVEDAGEQAEAISYLGRVSAQRYLYLLEEFAESPVPSISQRAVSVLRGSGLVESDVIPVEKKAKSYRLQLTAGGQPLSGQTIAFEQGLDHKDASSTIIFGGMDTVRLDEEGKFGFKRADAAHASDTRAFIRISAGREDGEYGTVPLTTATPVFSLAKEFGELDSGTVNRLEVAPYEFTLVLHYPNGRTFDAEEGKSVTLDFIHSYPEEEESESPVRNAYSFYLMRTDHLESRFMHVGPGTVEIQVAAPGCRIAEAKIAVGESSERRLDLQLEPGFALRYSVEGGSEEDYYVELLKLERDGEGNEVESYVLLFDSSMEISEWEHLGPGKYRFLVYESGLNREVLFERTFSIEERGPQVIDLGKVVIPEE